MGQSKVEIPMRIGRAYLIVVKQVRRRMPAGYAIVAFSQQTDQGGEGCLQGLGSERLIPPTQQISTHTAQA